MAYARLGLGSPERDSERRIPVKVGRVPGWGAGRAGSRGQTGAERPACSRGQGQDGRLVRPGVVEVSGAPPSRD